MYRKLKQMVMDKIRKRQPEKGNIDSVIIDYEELEDRLLKLRATDEWKKVEPAITDKIVASYISLSENSDKYEYLKGYKDALEWLLGWQEQVSSRLRNLKQRRKEQNERRQQRKKREKLNQLLEGRV